MGGIFAIMAISLTSCSNSDDEPSISISQSQLTGLWDATDVQFNNDGKWLSIVNRPDLALSITFYEDGTYYGEGALGNGEGTYTLTNNTIKTFVDGELYATYVVNSLSADKVELSMAMGKETMLIRATKSKISLLPNNKSIVAYNGDSNGDYWWESNRFDGDKLYRKELQITEWTFMPHNSIYTIIDDQVDKLDMFCLIIEVEGKKYRTLLDSQTPFEIYRYSFDGKTLVTRNYDTKEERVYSASVDGNILIISDGQESEKFTKVTYTW